MVLTIDNKSNKNKILIIAISMAIVIAITIYLILLVILWGPPQYNLTKNQAKGNEINFTHELKNVVNKSATNIINQT